MFSDRMFRGEYCYKLESIYPPVMDAHLDCSVGIRVSLKDEKYLQEVKAICKTGQQRAALVHHMILVSIKQTEK